MNILVLLFLSLIVTPVAVVVTNRLVQKFGLIRPNFRGDKIPTSYGFMLVLAAAPVYLAMCIGMPHVEFRTVIFLIVVIAFGVAGFVDDLYGSREIGGFRGHFSLLFKGKVTTGVIKAFVGGITAIAVGVIIAQGQPGVAVINALLIVLAANSLNLLDLRPGRAVSCFWVGLLVLVILRQGNLDIWHELTVLLLPALWLTKLDRSAKIMLGDAGSNTLGAVLGLALAFEINTFGKLIIVIMLGFLQVYAEKYSITKLIESNRIMREIDRRMGVR